MPSDAAKRQMLRLPGSVQESNRETGFHPTQKAVALFEYLIRTYTNPDEIVLDSCIGSGTTAIAAINSGRRYIGFEKEQKYFEIAQKRSAEHSKHRSSEAAQCDGIIPEQFTGSGTVDDCGAARFVGIELVGSGTPKVVRSANAKKPGTYATLDGIFGEEDVA